MILNSTLWADIAHPTISVRMEITKTGDEVLECILFKNIDILEHDEDDRDYQGCMTINVGDHNLAQNTLLRIFVWNISRKDSCFIFG